MTNIELITRALLKLGVINESETPSAEQGQDALKELNQMLEEWDEAGIRLGWCEQTDISNTAPLPPYAERGVTLRLALALAPSYGGAASVTPALIADAEESYHKLHRKAMLKLLKESDSRNMPQAEGGVSGFNILTGS
jgi:hypothetical protein